MRGNSVSRPRVIKNPCINTDEKNRTFVVCSYGGCGSSMLSNALRKYGNVVHSHARYPPQKLRIFTLTGLGGEISPEHLHKFKVIFIYKDPVKAIYSRFTDKQHLKHIGSNPYVTIPDFAHKKIDLYQLEAFYDNFVNDNDRNYKIYCVKYEELFEKQDELSKVLELPEPLCLTKKETNRQRPHAQDLETVYKPLKDKMAAMPFIHISQ